METQTWEIYDDDPILCYCRLTSVAGTIIYCDLSSLYVRQMCWHLSTPRTDIKTLFCSGKNVAAHLSAGVTLPWSFLFYGPIGVELRSTSRLPVKVFVPYPIKKPEFKSPRGTPYSKAHSFSSLLSTQLQTSTSHQAWEVSCVRLTFCLVGSNN